jgi:hypothetical protein
MIIIFTLNYQETSAEPDNKTRATAAKKEEDEEENGEEEGEDIDIDDI